MLLYVIYIIDVIIYYIFTCLLHIDILMQHSVIVIHLKSFLFGQKPQNK